MADLARKSWLPPPWHLALVSIVAALSAAAGIELTRQSGNIAAIWFTNGILLAVLLVHPSRKWPALLAAGLLGFGVAAAAAGHSPVEILVLLGSGAIGVVAPAALLRHGPLWRRREALDVTVPEGFIRFTVIGVLLTPGLSGLFGAALLAPIWHAPFPPLLLRWYLGDALGIAVMTPLALSVLRGELAPLLAPAALAGTLGVAGTYLLVVTAVFAQDHYPLLYLAFPPLLLVVSRLGFPGAGLIVLPTAAISFGATFAGRGPMLLIDGITAGQRLALLQIYLVILCATAYSIGVIVSERRRLHQALVEQNGRLAASERLYRLLADNASDIITRVRMDGERLYVSPSALEVLGWSVEEMLRADWQQNVHPDDFATFLSVRQRMDGGAMRAGATYRYRRKDGRWAWLDARARMVRAETGEPDEFIGILRDVTRQKEAELALEVAMAKLALQASTDALTGIANRRRFDETLAPEWRRAMRMGDPLSLLLIDVDHFKAFNDHYGHQAGDDCLCRIAEAIAGVVRRPHDLVARYGGEEFVAVLPATAQDGAARIAEAVRLAVAGMEMPHARAAAGAVTISIGVAAAIPSGAIEPATLIEAADTALYAAKRAGRNRVVIAGRDGMSQMVADRSAMPARLDAGG